MVAGVSAEDESAVYIEAMHVARDADRRHGNLACGEVPS